MSQQLSKVAAVLRKDLRLFWPLAVVTAALIMTERMDSLFIGLSPDLAGIVAAFVQLAWPLATIVLVLSVIHEDATVSVNHDWLSRPIPGGGLLAAKSIFVVLVVIGASIVGQVAEELIRGHGITEALLGGVVWGTKGDTWMVLVAVTSLASMTANLRQAIVLTVIAILSVIVIWFVSTSISKMINAQGIFGIDWIVERTLMVVVIATGVGVLWIQYAQRDLRTSWILLLTAAVGLTVLLSLASWHRGFAIQKSLAPAPAAALAVTVEPVNGCFAASRTDDRGGLFSVTNLGAIPMRVLAERVTRSDDIIFATTLRQIELPANGKLVVDRVIGAFYQDGRVEETSLQLARFTPRWTESAGELTANHYWLLSRRHLDRLAALPNVEFHLDYFLTLLAPTASIEIPTDGSRQSYPGIGYCSATISPGTSMADVSCLKWGAQPALLFAKPVGASDDAGKASDYPNYVPTALDFLGGKAHSMQFALPSGVTRVQITAYEAQAHFDRQVVVPGVLGGSPSACPAPG